MWGNWDVPGPQGEQIGGHKVGDSGVPDIKVQVAMLSLTPTFADTLLNVFLAIAVDNLANAQELTKVELVGECCCGKVTTCSWQIRTVPGGGRG